MQGDGFAGFVNEARDVGVAILFPVGFLDDLSMAQSTGDIMSVLTRWVPKIVETDHFSINLKVDNDYLSTFALGDDVSTKPVMPVKGTAMGYCYLTEKLQLTPDASGLDVIEPDLKALAEDGLRCVMNAPLLVAGTCFGTLSIAHKTPEFYGPEQAQVFQSLAGWVASNLQVYQYVGKLIKRERAARKLAIIAEHSNDILIITDRDRKIQWGNQAFEKITEYRLKDVVGRTTSDIFTGPNTNSEVMAQIYDEIYQGREAHGEVISYSKSGREIWIDINIKPIFDKNGDIEMFISTNRDITEAKLAEKKLRDSEAQSKQLAIFAEETDDIVLITNTARELSWVNPAFEKTYGYKLEEVIGKQPVALLMGPDTNPETLEKMRQQLQRGETVHEEIMFYSKSGEEIWIQVNLNTILNDQNEPDGIVGIQHNITKIKQREEELKKAREEADRSNKLKSEFLANMSHEIRTPLNGVLGMAQLLERSDLDENQRKFTEIICSSGNSLLSIINDVLDISKVEAGLLELEDESFNVDDLIRQTIDTVSGIALEKGLSLSHETAIAGRGEFMGDAKRIRQILINLAGNAVKFTPQGGVHISATRDETCVRFSVKDSGPGISVEQQQTIFERFRQADGSSTRTHGGTGLGLAISADLVALMGGEIGVESTPEQGAMFWFTLPLTETKTALDDAVGDLREIAAKGQERVPQEKIKLLLTEDNIVNQKVVTAALQMEGGFDIVIAENGIEALECLEEQVFDVVLMDIQMPIMNGDEAIGKIRASGKSYADVPIIALTANAMNDAHKEYLSIGATAYHSKPVNIQNLIECVKKLAGAKSSLTSVA